MKKMNTDPTAYIIAAAIVGSVIGFFGCALFASRAIRKTEEESYRDGFEACNRGHHNPSRELPNTVPMRARFKAEIEKYASDFRKGSV